MMLKKRCSCIGSRGKAYQGYHRDGVSTQKRDVIVVSQALVGGAAWQSVGRGAQHPRTRTGDRATERGERERPGNQPRVVVRERESGIVTTGKISYAREGKEGKGRRNRVDAKTTTRREQIGSTEMHLGSFEHRVHGTRGRRRTGAPGSCMSSGGEKV